MNLGSTNYKLIIGTVITGVLVFSILKRKSMGSAMSNVKGRNGQIATSIFDFDIENIDSKSVSMETFKGKKIYYVVNVATNWGLTKKNYAEMQILYDRYSTLGLEILAFPCNNVSTGI